MNKGVAGWTPYGIACAVAFVYGTIECLKAPQWPLPR